jgi:putative endonuclease
MVKGWSGWKWPGKDGGAAPEAGPAVSAKVNTRATTKSVGDAAEDRALAHLQRQGLQLVLRNYRLAGGPRQRAGEVDLILRAPDGTLVFVEVRARAASSHGGAAASVLGPKQRRIVRAAQHYLLALPVLPPCRFDVVAIDGDRLQWLPAAFDAG